MFQQTSISGLASQVDLLQGQRVLIVGDIILDRYQFGVVERISPEAPVPVVKIVEEQLKLGGAANVARNISCLGGSPLLIGATGNDPARKHLDLLLQEEDIDNILIGDPEGRTTLKTRVLAQGQQVVRIDQELSSPNQDVGRRILTALQDNLSDYEVVIVSDYGKGAIEKNLLEYIQREVPSRAKLIIDPKINNFHLYQDPYLLTPNKKEAMERSGVLAKDKNDLLELGHKIMDLNKSRNLLITLGAEGMLLFLDAGGTFKISTVSRKVFDVTGAGDTVVAVLGLALSSGAGLIQSCLLANFAAGMVVGQVGTAAVSGSELKENLLQCRDLPAIEKWE